MSSARADTRKSTSPAVCACRARSARSRPLVSGPPADSAATTAGGRATEFQSGPCQSQPLPRRNGHRCGIAATARLVDASSFQVHGLASFVQASLFPSAAAPEPIEALSIGRVTTRLTVVLNEFASASRDPFCQQIMTSVCNCQQNYIATLDPLASCGSGDLTIFEQAGVGR
jgi:hypothetical protein